MHMLKEGTIITSGNEKFRKCSLSMPRTGEERNMILFGKTHNPAEVPFKFSYPIRNLLKIHDPTCTTSLCFDNFSVHSEIDFKENTIKFLSLIDFAA